MSKEVGSSVATRRQEALAKSMRGSNIGGLIIATTNSCTFHWRTEDLRCPSGGRLFSVAHNAQVLVAHKNYKGHNKRSMCAPDRFCHWCETCWWTEDEQDRTSNNTCHERRDAVSRFLSVLLLLLVTQPASQTK